MDFASLMYAVGSIGFFSSRVFLPAFITALLLRFGGQIPLVNHWGLLNHIVGQPVWFTYDITLIALGILAVLEILAEKNPEIRQLLLEFDMYLKPALALLSTLGVMSATDASFLQHAPQQAGVANAFIPLLAAIGTFRAAALRNRVAALLFEHIEGSPLEHLISWLEDAWVSFGILFLILFPILILILITIVLLALWGVSKHLQVQEEHRKIPCRNCSLMIYPSAVSCPSCKTLLLAPVAVGFLGQSKSYPDPDPKNHPFRLTEKRRCAACATRLPPRNPFHACPTCHHTALADASYFSSYISFLNRRLLPALGICFLLGLVPILGLIAGVVYFRIALILPFTQYLPLGRQFLLRWGLRILLLILIVLQVMPLLGALTVPAMALVSFLAYRTTFRSILPDAPPAIPIAL